MALPHVSAMSDIYMEVVMDVLKSMRDVFAEDGVDESVLEELGQLWKEKILAANRRIEQVKKEPTPPPPPVLVKHMPVQVKLPAAEGRPAKQLIVNVPAHYLQNNRLQEILTGPVISAALNLPAEVACQMLQEHINRTASKVPQGDGTDDTSSDENATSPTDFLGYSYPANAIPPHKIRKLNPATGDGLAQSDGPDNSSESELDSDDLIENEEPDQVTVGPEEEPLNSDDDISDEEVVDMYDTDNVIVCQYDKIHRNRNKWKFLLKDGIIHSNGVEFAFHKAIGDAEW